MDAILSLTILKTIAAEHVMLAAAIFTRMSALVFFMPGIGERAVPMRVRLAVAMALSFVLLPMVQQDFAPPQAASGLTLLLAAEAITGALIGFSIRIAVFAIQTAGAISSQSLSLAQLFNSSIGYDQESPIATLLMFAAIVLAVSAGLHFEIIGLLIFFYDLIPLGLFPGAGAAGEWAAGRAAFAFSAAISLALPFMVLGFIYNLAIGAANRAMPQLMVAFVGIPAVTLAGMALLAMAAPVILDIWMGMMRDLMAELHGYAP